eukprot:2795759-Prymnesium_polylepis.1
MLLLQRTPRSERVGSQPDVERAADEEAERDRFDAGGEHLAERDRERPFEREVPIVAAVYAAQIGELDVLFECRVAHQLVHH